MKLRVFKLLFDGYLMKKKPSRKRYFRPYLRYLAYAQIILQGVLPASLAFTPTVMAAQQPTAKQPVYSKLIPSLALPDLGSTVDGQAKATESTGPTDQSVAKNAKALAGIAANDNASGAAQQYATGLITGQATQEIEQWLNQYGNARVTINTHTHDSANTMDGSSIDFLYPLINKKDNLTFMQFGTHYQDDSRLVGNIGIGQRFFTQSGWMLGANAFYDQDLTGTTSRAGIGIEAWRDYFKFSSNGYFALSDWTASDELDDYDEKAANGFDIQFDAYLPSLPMLGGKLKYEKYYGHNVALFDTDHLQDDPYAVTLGLNYTPVPLITMGVDYKKGQSDLDDTSFKVDMNYALGVPWSEQISPDAVAMRHSLAGSKMDFVNRNNDIVMQYRKEAVIKLALPNEIDGEVKSKQTLTASISSKHGADHIQWDPSSPLLMAGGQITKVDVLHYTVTMPDATGAYVLRGTAYDTKGNESNTAETLFTANQSVMNATVTVDNTQVTVGQNATYTVAVSDTAGKPVSGAKIAWTTDFGAFSSQNTQTGSDGKATAVLSSTQVGVANVVATVNDGAPNKAPQVNFINDMSGVTVSLLTLADPKSVVANGSAVLTYTATLTNQDGSPVAQQDVNWTTTLGSLAATSSKTNDQGQATVKLVSSVVGKATVSASFGDSVLQNSEGQFTEDTSDMQVTLEAAPATSIPADNSTLSALTAFVKKSDGTPVTNENVSWTIVSGQGGTLGSVSGTTGADGSVTTTLKSGTPGDIVVGVALVADAAKTAQTTVNFSVVGSISTLTLSDPKSVMADGIAKLTYTATVVDLNNAPVPAGQTVSWATSLGDLSSTTSITDAQGKATIMLTSTIVGNAVVGATFNGVTKANSEGSFTQNLTGMTVTLKPDNGSDPSAVVTGDTGITLTAHVADKNNAVVSGATIDWSVSSPGNATITPIGASVTDGNGDVKVKVTDNTVETVSLKATATMNGVSASSAPQSITFVRDATKDVISLAADVTQLIADGSSKSTLTATVVDGSSAPVAGVVVTFTRTSGEGTLQTVSGTTNAQGQATATLVSDTVGDVVITSTIAAGAIRSDNATINFTRNASGDALTLSANPNTLNVGESSTLSAVVVDAAGTSVPDGVKVTWSITSGNGALGAAETMTTNGTATNTLTSTAGGDVEVTAMLENGANKKTTITFTSAVVVPTAVALGTPASAYWTDYDLTNPNAGSLVATVTGSGGAAAAAAPVTFKCLGGCTTDAGSNAVTASAEGKATVKVASTTAGTTGITLQACTIGANNSDVCSSTVTLPFYNPPVITDHSLIGDNSIKSMPAVRLQGGEMQFMATGGDGSYSWATSSTAYTIDNDGLLTVGTSAAATNITVSTMGRTSEAYAIAAGTNVMTVTTEATYNWDAATAACASGNMSSETFFSVMNAWGGDGAINRYSRYESTGQTSVWTSDNVDTDSANYALLSSLSIHASEVKTTQMHMACVK